LCNRETQRYFQEEPGSIPVAGDVPSSGARESRKGLKVPWRHCLDPFSELLSGNSKGLTASVFFPMKNKKEVVVFVVAVSGAAMQ